MIVILIISVILCTCFAAKTVKLIKLTKKQNERITFLEMHNRALNDLYESVKIFRHDFANFAIVLDGYAKLGNIDGVRKMSAKAMEQCKEVNRVGALSPNLIDNPAIYSILTNKFYRAQEEGIKMNIEVYEPISNAGDDVYEVCRILGILLDNAIEAAKITDEKILNVTFKREVKMNRRLIIIENSYNNKTVDINKIFEKGYTSKDGNKESHGIGLYNIKNILQKNEDLNLYTTADELFRQQLEIY